MQLEGRVIGGDFRVERELARGGMGGVWLAEQLSTAQKRAVKVMHPTLVANERMRERFVQEARVGARIPSEHVVEVIAAGVDPELGVPWLAMELLQGEDLAAFAARRGPLPLSELVSIYRQLCHALAAAHAVGVVHRDVKPENVFLADVRSADASRQVKVLDFGIAKLVAEAKESGTGQVGTPLWMAPEQSDPRASISPAADVWALGLVAFRLLTGRNYWRTANDPNAALSALLRETLIEPVVRASERAREYGMEAALGPGFDDWFARTVAREPSERYPEAHSAFVALEALASGATLPAAAPPMAASATVSPSVTATRTSTAAPPASRAPLFLLLGVGALLLGGVLFVALGAGAWLYTENRTSAETPAGPGAAQGTSSPPIATSAASAASADPPSAKTAGTSRTARPANAPSALTGGDKVPAAAETAPAAAAAPPPEPAPAASAPAGALKPIDIAAVQKKVNAAAAAASVECAKFKTPGAASETYTGSRGFRPDGTGAGGMSGGGGAQECVKNKMFNIYIGKYAHPQEWHVESFSWTVTVK